MSMHLGFDSFGKLSGGSELLNDRPRFTYAGAMEDRELSEAGGTGLLLMGGRYHGPHLLQEIGQIVITALRRRLDLRTFVVPLLSQRDVRAAPQAVLSSLAGEDLDGRTAQQMLLLYVDDVAARLAQAAADASVSKNHRSQKAAAFDGVALIVQFDASPPELDGLVAGCHGARKTGHSGAR
jgi:hypothetical protein